MSKIYKFLCVFFVILFCFIHIGSASMGSRILLLNSGTKSGATLTISSASIDTTGQILTINIAGAKGSLTPSSAITGITLHETSTSQYYLNTSTTSGSTITVNLGSFVVSGLTPTVDLLSTSNLRDSKGDSPTGQLGVAVTNNTTVPGTGFPYNSTGMYFFGSTYNGSYYRNFVAIPGWNSASYFETATVGSSAEMLVLGGFGNPSITVDGGGPTTFSNLPSNVWSWVTLYSGLSNTAHNVTITANYLDQSTIVRVSGSGAAVQAPAGFGTFYLINNSPPTANIARDGYAVQQTTNGNTDTQWAYSNASIRFNGTLSSLSILYNGFGGGSSGSSGNVILYQDGVQIGNTLTQTGVGNWYLQSLATGLSGTHVYQIFGTAFQSNYFSGLLLGPGDTINSGPPTALNTESFYGDSITAGYGLLNGSTAFNSRQIDSYALTQADGTFAGNVGVSGSKVSTYGRDNTSTVTTITPEPSRVWIRYGTNDAEQTVPIGAVGSPGTFTGDFYTMLVNMRSGLGSSTIPIIVEQIFPTTLYSISAYNTAIVTAVNTYITNTGDTHVLQVPTGNWFNPTCCTYTIDGRHPNAAGYALIANNEIPLGASTGYTETGPTSGTHGTASTNFTVTIASGAAFAGYQTVTISDGGNGGTFTPSVGSPATSSVTVTTTSGATSFTFTYNAASAGAKTLTFTNGQSWTNITPKTYTAS